MSEDDSFDIEDLAALSITKNLFRALGLLDFSLTTGSHDTFKTALERLTAGCTAATQAQHVPLWWINTLARHLAMDLWSFNLHARLPPTIEGPASAHWQELRRDFIALQLSKQVAATDLWPSQVEAASRSVNTSDNLIVALPTSAGKTRIAELCILRTLADKLRVIYVTPLRALSAQVEQTLARTFRPLGYSVSALYGASGVANADIEALDKDDIVVATPEKLDFSIRQQPDLLNTVGLIVLDEGHMIGLGAREVRYEVLVQRLLSRADASNRRLVCLSAIFSPGEAFSDFTAWLRSDSPGGPVQSTWRPTRQRPAVLRWNAPNGRLDFLVDEEPFVPQFLEEEKPATKQRKNDFPQNDNELVAALIKRLLTDQHSVLVYCPQRRSVEALARTYITLIKQKHAPAIPVKTDAHNLLARAIAIGNEYLGKEHTAVRALHHGLAVHHGGLPRAFLAEIENLLAARYLKVAFASPTLAQGIDLSCSALILRGIHRGSKVVTSNGRSTRIPTLIPPEELSNVMGRAGRAFVDLDGLSIYPISDKSHTKQTKKQREFESLLSAAQTRQLKSGLVELVAELAERLRHHLGDCSWAELEEYIFNTSGVWDSDDTWYTRKPSSSEHPPGNDDDKSEHTGIELLDSLDTAILASVEQLDCPPSEIAQRLDDTLQSSLWRRHLVREPPEVQGAIKGLLSSRAEWLWSNTTPPQRRALFASSVGQSTGGAMSSILDTLADELARADLSFTTGNTEDAVLHTISLIEHLSDIPKFATSPKDRPSDWKLATAHWLRGTPLAAQVSIQGPNYIEFVQDGLVYRMVWALEAVRAQAAILEHPLASLLNGATSRALTYGVPTLQAAIFLQSGFPSREIALQLLQDFPGNFTNPRGLDLYLRSIAPVIATGSYWSSTEKQIIWDTFIQSRQHERNREWGRWEELIDVVWTVDSSSVLSGSDLRIIRTSTDPELLICTPDYQILGKAKTWPPNVEAHCIFARATVDKRQITASCFGPID
ncbi:DEAD/DEAH box helicase [Myxococcus faecalis]|uniref:DEAD/DEAH box helicase n=1 Tax=Myxococcus faecalis TaxID=3115646 RepID=UPI003CEA7EC3